MKRFFVIISALVMFGMSVQHVLANQDITINTTDSSGVAILSPSPTLVDYQLPYPGLLPDNFLYRLKTFRDKVIEFLISDPLKKAEFDILQGDKRYNASLFLYRASPQEEDIIVSTISKADNYMDEAVGQLDLAKKQGENINDMVNKFILSDTKHLEVIREIDLSARQTLKNQLTQEEGRIAELKRMVIQSKQK